MTRFETVESGKNMHQTDNRDKPLAQTAPETFHSKHMRSSSKATVDAGRHQRPAYHDMADVARQTSLSLPTAFCALAIGASHLPGASSLE